MQIARSLLLLGFAAATASAQQRPLITEIPELVDDGKARLEAGVDFFQGQPFPLSGLRGDFTRLGMISGRVGFGSRIEFQVQGALGNFLNIQQRDPAPFSGRLRLSGDSASDIGDFLFATKINLRSETAPLPSISFRVGAILPNSANDSGLGINTTRTFGTVLLGKHLGKTHLFSNLGIIIIDNPAELATQSDKFTYGFAFSHPLGKRVNVVGEIQGMHGNPHAGTEDSSQVRLGAQLRAAGLVWDIAGLAGLLTADPDSGVIFGVSRDFQIFKVAARQPSAFRFDSLLFQQPGKVSVRQEIR